MKHFLTILLLAATTLVQAQQKIDFSQFYPDAAKNPGTVTPIQHFDNTENYYENTISVRDFGQEVGQAFKLAGEISLGVGIPSLLAGTILLAVGYGTSAHMSQVAQELKHVPDRRAYDSNEEYNRAMAQYREKSKQYKNFMDKQEAYTQCATAGCVILPFGAAMTIVGIPLFIKGQHLLDLKIDYTGNGAGLALAW